MPKTKIEIIKETFEFYSNDISKRAANEAGACWYLHPLNGNKCAVGRCMNEKARFDASEYISSYVVSNALNSLDDHLKEDYHGHSLEFWKDLQSLHDNNGNWDKREASKGGKAYYSSLLEKYA